MIESGIGYPQWLWRALGHPVSWIGRIIGWADRRFNGAALRPGVRRVRGVGLVVLLLLVAGATGGAVQWLCGRSVAGTALLALLASSLFAQRSLHSHVARVAEALERDVASGRAAVAHIVGRDTATLDGAGVARAAIESLAENFSDGIVAPAFWMAIAGLPGAACYKAINTADSMVGHRTPRYEAFGKAAARTDDVVNWPAARLAGVLLVGAAGMTRRASARAGWRAMCRDARGHRSPNAGWPEAAMAGALGLQLAGPRQYHGAVVPDAFMGNGRQDAGAADIRAALALYRRAVLLLWLLLAGVIVVGAAAFDLL